MTREELDQIEHALGLVLPPAYRQIMTAYPFPADSPAAELWVLNEVDSLVEINRTYREDKDHPWPAHLFLIGSDGGEEAYVLDTSVDPSPVRVYELETGKFRSYAPDYAGFIQLQTQALAEVDADKRALAAAYQNKRWWQFWIRPYPTKRT